MSMRTLCCLVLAAALVLPGSPQSPRAAVEISVEQPGPTLELIVIEARGCPMCRLFRDEIAPVYRATARAKRAPMRFVNVSFTDPATLNLVAPVEIVPTVVLMRDGAEIDRLVGYTGPEIFMTVVGRMLGDTP
jgi:thioredoxin-related protein